MRRWKEKESSLVKKEEYTHSDISDRCGYTESNQYLEGKLYWQLQCSLLLRGVLLSTNIFLIITSLFPIKQTN